MTRPPRLTTAVPRAAWLRGYVLLDTSQERALWGEQHGWDQLERGNLCACGCFCAIIAMPFYNHPVDRQVTQSGSRDRATPGCHAKSASRQRTE
eukprot:4930694-Prymnesium_polylepis.1